MKRRSLIKSLAAGSILSGVGVFPSIALSASVSTKKLVVIFQRGGNDGLNTLVPFNTSAYYDYRKTLAVAEPSSKPDSAIALTSGIPTLDGTEFGFHPVMA